jgi:hypothetical protein
MASSSVTRASLSALTVVGGCRWCGPGVVWLKELRRDFRRELRMIRAELVRCAAQSVQGAVRRHLDVGDHHVCAVAADLGQQIGGVSGAALLVDELPDRRNGENAQGCLDEHGELLAGGEVHGDRCIERQGLREAELSTEIVDDRCS